MKEERKQELKRLLIESQKHVYIERRGEVISASRYREYHLYKGYDPSIRSYRSISPRIKEGPIKNQLLDFIQDELSEYIVDGMLYPVVTFVWGGKWQCSLEDFLQSLLRISIVWGGERAILNLERYLDENYVPFQHVALITGIKVDKELKISDKVRLIPLHESPEELPDYLPIDRERFMESHFLGKALLLIEKIAEPAFFTSGKLVPPPKLYEKIMGDENEKFKATNFCVALSLVCNNPVQISIGWTNLSEDEFLCEIGGRGTASFHPIVNRINSRIVESQIKDAMCLHHKLSDLELKDLNVLRVAIYRLASSHLDKGIVDKMIDLGIAFESLYLNRGNRDQLAVTFRIRAAWYLGKDAEDRRRLMKLLRRVYKYRSMAVHAGQLPGAFKVGKEWILMLDFIQDAQELCRQTIMKVIQAGKFPDWDDLIVGKNGT